MCSDHCPVLPLLDRRLKTAAEMAGAFQRFADIGADHGQLSAVLLHEDPDRIAVVSDISEKALSHARERLALHDLSSRAFVCLSDGLQALREVPFAPQVVFILGMGGQTIADILSRGAELLRGAVLILGAHTEETLLRSMLPSLGYRIADERFLWENAHHYVLIRAEASPEKVSYSPKEIFLGPVLMKHPTPEWTARLQRRAQVLKSEIAAMENRALPAEKQISLAEKRRQLRWIYEITENR